MSAFTLYKNTNPDSKAVYPYFINIQNDLLDDLNSRIVLPVTPIRYLENLPIDTLCPVLDLGDERYAVLTHQVTTIPTTALREAVTSVEYLREEIIAAIDLLVTGI